MAGIQRKGEPNMIKRALLRGCNNTIDEFLESIKNLQQYSPCIVLIVPKKYEERIINELELLNNDFNTPIPYQIGEGQDDFITVSLMNMGVMQKEAILNSFKGDGGVNG